MRARWICLIVLFALTTAAKGMDETTERFSLDGGTLEIAKTDRLVVRFKRGKEERVLLRYATQDLQFCVSFSKNNGCLKVELVPASKKKAALLKLGFLQEGNRTQDSWQTSYVYRWNGEDFVLIGATKSVILGEGDPEKEQSRQVLTHDVNYATGKAETDAESDNGKKTACVLRHRREKEKLEAFNAFDVIADFGTCAISQP
jgi:hypothetical protein